MLQVNPKSVTALATLVTVKITEKDCIGAGEYASRLQLVDSTTFRAVFARAAVDICQGDKSGPLKLLEQSGSPLRNAPAFELANLYTFMGDNDRAIQYLQQAIGRYEFAATSIKQQPYLQTLHRDPRFIALERRLDLPN